MVKVTVAMASYNHEAFVGQAIESVLAQQNCEFEFIIVDDGSTDGTVKEIQRYQDPRLRLIQFEKNEGACLALRKAIEAGSAPYVAILNSDDAFLPEKLHKQAAFLDAYSSIGAVFGFAQFINAHHRPLKETDHFYGSLFNQSNRSRFDWLRYFFFHGNALCHPTVMIRRQCYQKVGYYDPRLVQLPDFDFWVRLLLYWDIHVMQEPLTLFRILPHEANTSAPNEAALRRSQWETIHVLQNFLRLQTVQDYFTVFPEDRALFEPYTEQERPFLIPFALGSQALRGTFHPQVEAAYRLFGIQTLFPLMNHPIVQETLAPKVNLNLANFGRKVGDYEIFDLNQTSSPRQLFKELCLALKNRVFNP